MHQHISSELSEMYHLFTPHKKMSAFVMQFRGTKLYPNSYRVPAKGLLTSDVHVHLRVCVCFVCMQHQIRAKSFTYNPRWLEAMQSACLSTPSQFFCVSPPGGASPGWSDPTVDTTVSLQPMPTYWYYVIAGGGAVFLLGCVTLVMVLCCHRYHLAAKKSQHSVSYQSTYTGQYTGGGTGGLAGPGVEPMLTIRLEKQEPCSQC